MDVFLYSLVLWSAFISSSSLIDFRKEKKKKVPITTLSLSAILLATLVTQLFYPSLLLVFERNTTLILNGDFWRLFTALFFQDGGILGGIINILYLLLIGSIAEAYFGKRRLLLIYFLGGLFSECIALFWQPIGAGNSVANFALAGSLLFFVLTKASIKLKVLSVLGFIGAVCLIFLKDIHGSAVIIGMLCALSVANIKKK